MTGFSRARSAQITAELLERVAPADVATFIERVGVDGKTVLCDANSRPAGCGLRCKLSGDRSGIERRVRY
jgi:hypothetical protein